MGELFRVETWRRRGEKIALPMSHSMLGAGGEAAILANESSLGSHVKINEIIITESGIL